MHLFKKETGGIYSELGSSNDIYNNSFFNLDTSEKQSWQTIL